MLTSTDSLRSQAPVIAGESVASALIAAHRRIGNPANWSPHYPHHSDGEPATSSFGLRSSDDVRAGLLDTIDLVCGEDLDLHVAACEALRAARDTADLPHNLRSLDRHLGREAALQMLDSAIGQARTRTWDGHPKLVLPQGPPNRETYEAMCLIRQLIQEIHLAIEPCAQRHDATPTINEHHEGELREIEQYLYDHARRVRRLERARRRRERFAGGLRTTLVREVARLLTSANLRGADEQLPEIPF